MDTISHISHIPLFEGLPEYQLEALSKIVFVKQVSRGHIIFSEGQKGEGFYVALSGKVKIFKISTEGKEQILHIFGHGEPFGEVAVFTGEKFPAHAQAIEESRLLFFPRNAFVSLIKHDPNLALNMLALLSRRLHRFTTLVENLSLKEVPDRLAAYLIYLSQGNKNADMINLDISKGHLASLLGTIPETLSRILSKMIKDGLIESDGRRSIRIINRNGLEELAEGNKKDS